MNDGGDGGERFGGRCVSDQSLVEEQRRLPFGSIESGGAPDPRGGPPSSYVWKLPDDCVDFLSATKSFGATNPSLDRLVRLLLSTSAVPRASRTAGNYPVRVRTTATEGGGSSGTGLGCELCDRCVYHPETRAGATSPTERKMVKRIIQWIERTTGAEVQVNPYDQLFKTEELGKGGGDFTGDFNPERMEVVEDVQVEPSLCEAAMFSCHRWEGAPL